MGLPCDDCGTPVRYNTSESGMCAFGGVRNKTYRVHIFSPDAGSGRRGGDLCGWCGRKEKHHVVNAGGHKLCRHTEFAVISLTNWRCANCYAKKSEHAGSRWCPWRCCNCARARGSRETACTLCDRRAGRPAAIAEMNRSAAAGRSEDQSVRVLHQGERLVCVENSVWWYAEEIALHETEPVIVKYEFMPLHGTSEVIGAFSLNRRAWGEGACDALTWYAAPHRHDFTFRGNMFATFFRDCQERAPANVTPLEWHVMEVRLSKREASFAVDGVLFATLRNPAAAQRRWPTHGYLGMIRYDSDWKFRRVTLAQADFSTSIPPAAASSFPRHADEDNDSDGQGGGRAGDGHADADSDSDSDTEEEAGGGVLAQVAKSWQGPQALVRESSSLLAEDFAECVVCFEPMHAHPAAVLTDAGGTRRTCAHVLFHLHCAQAMLRCAPRKSCPVCRTPCEKAVEVPSIVAAPDAWFRIMDFDGSGSLNKREVLVALRASVKVDFARLERDVESRNPQT